jgi:hypothetical protein
VQKRGGSALARARGFFRCVAPALGTICALCAIGAPVALGASEFATEGEGAGQLSPRPKGIAVNQQSGDLYISDQENNRVEQFAADGTFTRTWGFGVSDGSSEAFQICEAPGPCFSGIAGDGGGQLSQPDGIAIDNSAGLSQGDVYVEDQFNHRIERFDAEGNFILAFGGEVNKLSKGDVCEGEECQAGTPGAGPGQFQVLERNAIAVGPSGTVYVGDVERVQKFSPAGVLEGEIPLLGAGVVEALAVDSTGHVYVLSGALEGIREYDGAGVEVGVRDPGAHGLGVAITIGEGDELLVSDPISQHVFGYDPSGTQLLSILESEDANGGIALAQSTKALYVIHVEPARVRVQTLPPPGPVVLEESQAASEVLTTSATLNARVNPEGPQATSCSFEYGPSEAYGSSTAPLALSGEAFEDQLVSAVIEGLAPAQTYHFRVVCENALNQTTAGPDQSFQTLPAVSIDSESVAKVTATSAKLIAELNPHGLATEYHFEYGLSSAYEASAPVPEASAGDGTADESFSVTIEQLQPGSTYHYRVVAHNSLGLVEGPDQTFSTQQTQPASLPDGRGYEMVSPADKHGSSLEALPEAGGAIEAAKDGSGLTYIATGPIGEEAEGSRSARVSQLLGKRVGPGAWSTRDITTAHEAPVGIGAPAEYKLFSSDLSRGAVQPGGATPLSASATKRTPYRREADGSFTPLVYPGDTAAGAEWGGEGQEVFFVTGTADLSHVLLRTRAALVQGFDNKDEEAVYEWSEGELSPVSILPGEVPSGEAGRAAAGNADLMVRNAISADGARAFFETSFQQRLYVRDTARGETLRVDAAAAGVKESEGGAHFQLASADGSEVLFTDQGKLTKDATASATKPDLYECAIVLEKEKLACELHDLSVDSHAGQSAQVLGAVIGASEDGRYVYFVAQGALSEGAVSGACPGAGEGQCVNLYAVDTQRQEKRLVAVLSAEDFPDWSGAPNSTGINLSRLTARVSPNGRYLAFMSERPLTGFDNRDAQSGARDEEVFVYHAPEDLAGEAGTLRCASCDPSGQRPAGAFDEGVVPGLLVDRPELWGGRWLAASIPGWTGLEITYALHQSRYLSDSGRLFFNSADGLVPADQNGTQDVYQFEPEGVGNCGESSGCVSLISAGSSSEESAFLDASESGDDVFFLSAAQISPADKDNALDVYDAHVCTLAPGCAGPGGGEPPPCASSDACRAAPSPQPDIFGAPSSATFSGAGNLAPAAKVKPKPLTRAQKLARALRACKKKPKRKRAACRRLAHRRFGSVHHAKKTAKGGRR